MSVTIKAIYANCIHKDNGCRLWKGATNRYGYPFVYDKSVYCTGPANNGMVGVRGAVWKAAGEPKPEGRKLVMTCNNRLCVRRDHMAAMTHSEAQKFAAIHGAYKSIRHRVARIANARKNAKNNHESVAAIKQEVHAGRPRSEVAAERGLCRSTIDQIMRGSRWATGLAPNASVFHQAA